jgi:hypothetical protein
VNIVVVVVVVVLGYKGLIYVNVVVVIVVVLKYKEVSLERLVYYEEFLYATQDLGPLVAV